MISYTLGFEPQHTISFAIDETGWYGDGQEAGEALPPWLLLDTCRCSHCTLPAGENAACPAALAIRPVIEAFATSVSYEKVSVRVETARKTLTLESSLQDAVRSLLGLHMALSTCPVMMRLRPMARFHQPFDDREHTIFRAIGMYLLAQHIRERKGLDGDRSLRGLADLYKKIHVINERMADRIRLASPQDAALNGLVILDVFAHGLEDNIRDELATWESLFLGYLDS